MTGPTAGESQKARRARVRARVFGEPPTDLIQYLAENDARCPACGYGLRGLPQPRCPECAMMLDLERVMREREIAGPHQVGFVEGELNPDPVDHPLVKVALFLLVGVCAVLLVFFLARAWTA